MFEALIGAARQKIIYFPDGREPNGYSKLWIASGRI